MRERKLRYSLRRRFYEALLSLKEIAHNISMTETERMLNQQLLKLKKIWTRKKFGD